MPFVRGLVSMPTRAMRLKTQARVSACLQAVCLTLSVVKEQSLSASLVRLEKELFPLYLRQGEFLLRILVNIILYSYNIIPNYATLSSSF